MPQILEDDSKQNETVILTDIIQSLLRLFTALVTNQSCDYNVYEYDDTKNKQMVKADLVIMFDGAPAMGVNGGGGQITVSTIKFSGNKKGCKDLVDLHLPMLISNKKEHDQKLMLLFHQEVQKVQSIRNIHDYEIEEVNETFSFEEINIFVVCDGKARSNLMNFKHANKPPDDPFTSILKPVNEKYKQYKISDDLQYHQCSVMKIDLNDLSKCIVLPPHVSHSTSSITTAIKEYCEQMNIDLEKKPHFLIHTNHKLLDSKINNMTEKYRKSSATNKNRLITNLCKEVCVDFRPKGAGQNSLPPECFVIGVLHLYERNGDLIKDWIHLNKLHFDNNLKEEMMILSQIDKLTNLSADILNKLKTTPKNGRINFNMTGGMLKELVAVFDNVIKKTINKIISYDYFAIIIKYTSHT